jgi:predicted GNAT family N-acyltransferase
VPRFARDELAQPLGLTLSPEELADDALRQHFCAVADDQVVGCASLKPLDGETLQLKQMAVAEAWRGAKIGARLVALAEAWALGAGFHEIVLHARIGAEGFYAKLGYEREGEIFEENTVPHLKMAKRLS